jgi:2-hydroxychromene-2-carboxylate isomerase
VVTRPQTLVSARAALLAVVAEYPRFFYDLRSADAWLAAERVVRVLGTVPEFCPVDLSGLAAGDVGPFRCAAEVDAHFEDIRRRAEAYETLALKPPPTYPPEDTRFALLAATYAKQIGKVVAFSLGCFRQTFNGGRDLADRDTVYLAGAAAEIHPAALEKGAALKGTAERLRVATAEAAELGVLDVPAIEWNGRVFHGDTELELAARS